MSDMQFLVLIGLIAGGFGVLGLGILFLYKKMLSVINIKQKEITNNIINSKKELTNTVNASKKELTNDIINSKKEITNNIEHIYKNILIKQEGTTNNINYRHRDIVTRQLEMHNTIYQHITNKFNTSPNNLNNLELYTGDKKTIVIIRNSFNTHGGITTRWKTFLPFIEQAGYRIVLIVDLKACSKELFTRYKTYYLNLGSYILTEELIRICYFENASLIEFHQNFIGVNIEKLSSFLPVGFAAHSNIYSRNNLEWISGIYKKLDEEYYKYLSFIVENSGVNANWDGYKNVVSENVICNSIDTDKYSVVFNNVGQKKALLVSRLSDEKLRNIEPFIVECQKRNITFDIIGSGPQKDYLQTTYNLADEVFLGQLSAVDYMQKHGSDYLFIAGASQVIMEALCFGYPALMINENSCFMTKNNFEKAMYNNFDDVIEIDKSFNEQFDDLYNGKLDDFDCRDLVVKHLDLATNANKYLAIYEKAMGV